MNALKSKELIFTAQDTLIPRAYRQQSEGLVLYASVNICFFLTKAATFGGGLNLPGTLIAPQGSLRFSQHAP